jgi:transcription elongation factor SPT6
MANDDESNSKEAFVIWGRPEIPKLFATSHYSQKLLKNHPFVLKKAICLARFEQDPLNEILNLWSPIMSENQALHLNLHPLQKHINQARLIDHLEQINTEFVNRVGVDINLLVDHEHWHNQLQFLSGLGPRKAQRYIQKLKSLGKPLYTRNEIYENKILKKNCFVSSLGFTKVRVPPEKRPDDMQTNILDQTRIHLRNYDHVYKLVTDCLYENQPDVEQYKQQQAVNQIIKNPEKLKDFAMGEYKE